MTKLDRLIAELCPDGVEYKALGVVCNRIVSGTNKHRSDFGQYSVYGSTGIIGHSDTFAYEHDAILIARVGANCGYVHLASGCYDVSDNTLIINPDENKYDIKFRYTPTISRVIKQCKEYVTKQIGFSPWQRNYHDHVIRNQEDYNRIAEYIENNPARWAEDRYYTG